MTTPTIKPGFQDTGIKKNLVSKVSRKFKKLNKL